MNSMHSAIPGAKNKWSIEPSICFIFKHSGSLRVRGGPGQSLTGFKGVPKNFLLPRSGEEKFLGLLGGPGAFSPRKF